MSRTGGQPTVFSIDTEAVPARHNIAKPSQRKIRQEKLYYLYRTSSQQVRPTRPVARGPGAGFALAPGETFGRRVDGVGRSAGHA